MTGQQQPTDAIGNDNGELEDTSLSFSVLNDYSNSPNLDITDKLLVKNGQNDDPETKFKWNFPDASEAEAIGCVKEELSKCDTFLEASKRIKQVFNTKFGTGWTCMVTNGSQHFSGAFSQHRDTVSMLELLFPLSRTQVVLFKYCSNINNNSNNAGDDKGQSPTEQKVWSFSAVSMPVIFCGVCITFIGLVMLFGFFYLSDDVDVMKLDTNEIEMSVKV